MKAITYKTTIVDGRAIVDTVERTGYPTSTPGLLVSDALMACREDGAEEWQVIHARSGAVFPFCWGSPEGALAYSGNVAWLADWRQDFDATAQTTRRYKQLLSGYAYDLGGRRHYVGGLGDGSIDNGVIA